MNSYEEKKQERVERYATLAEKHRAAGRAAGEQAHKMASAIPFGQPIHVGHHSEGRDRKYRERIGRTYDKEIEHYNKAEYYERKAHAAETNNAISRDDPDAIEKLQTRVKGLETLQEQMKACNKIAKSRRKNYPHDEKVRDLLALGVSEETATTILDSSKFGGLGIPGFNLTNNSANIRRLKQRIEELERTAQDETTETEIGDVRIVDNVEDNRVQVFFPRKPADDVRKRLKSSGFRWSPRNRCWQSYRGAGYLAAAQKIVS